MILEIILVKTPNNNIERPSQRCGQWRAIREVQKFTKKIVVEYEALYMREI
jgi:hypothetical protein